MSTPIKLSNPPEVTRGSGVISDDIAVHPEDEIAFELISRKNAKLVLLDLIRRFSSDAFVPAQGTAAAITKETAAAAHAMFDMILPAAKVPQISPDGEGGLLAVWDDQETPVMLVVDNWVLHLIVAAATPRAQYFEDLPFDGERLPPVVHKAIPLY
jgi:hypothetical protein